MNSHTRPVKKILILSYHYPPLNVIASARAQAYAENLHKQGWEPTVLTFDWNENGEISNTKVPIIEEKQHHRVIRLGRGEKQSVNAGKLQTWLHYRRGVFDLNEGLLACRQMAQSFLSKHLHQEKYEVVLGIYSPHFHLEQCHWIHTNFGIPYVLDFRDLWDIRLTSRQYAPTFGERVRDYYIGKFWRKWSKDVLFLSTVSEPYSEYLELSCLHSCITITNGFGAKLFDDLQKQASDKFVIAHIGSFYPDQKVETIFAAGSLLKDQTTAFEIRFVGVKNEEMRARIYKLAETHDLKDFVKILPRISREEALQETLDADLLYYPAWEGHQGVYSGKIFEYLASGNPILVAPRDFGVVDELIEETQSGASFEDDPATICEWVMSVFTDQLDLERKDHEIQIYSRESQVNHFARLLHQALIRE
ncbi:MAG: glycosyltransferase involved in cell wall biosynthesis [Litorivivens sp.]